MLVDDMAKMTAKQFESAMITKADTPHVGSIMNGAKIMYAMP